MKKTLIIVTFIILVLAFTGCTKGSSASIAGNQLSENVSTDSENGFVTEKHTENLSTKEAATDNFIDEPTTEHIEEDYNKEAKRIFSESDIPDSIKNVFLENGDFVDTQTHKTTTLRHYKVYETKLIYDEANPDALPEEKYDFENWKSVVEWSEYVAVDFDNDGKKELFFVYWLGSGNQKGVIFHEHTDGNVYAYGNQSLRVDIGENGDVVASAGAALTSDCLLRYSFDTEKLIETKIAYAELQDNGEYKYYAEGREIDEAEYGIYFKLLSEGGLNWTQFRITPVSESTQASGE